MNLVDKIKNAAIIGVCALAIGCSGNSPRGSGLDEIAGRNTKKINYPVYALPVNLAVGYFGGIATHEAGHVLVGTIQGIKITDFDILPGHGSLNGTQENLYLGRTIIRGHLSTTELRIFDIAGPASTFIAGIGSRELLKTGYVPKELQPSLAWYAVGNKAMTYYQAFAGLKGSNSNDFGRHDQTLPLVGLGLQFAYDIYDLGFSDKKFFDVLIGADFYTKDNEGVNISFESAPDEAGIFFVKKF